MRPTSIAKKKRVPRVIVILGILAFLVVLGLAYASYRSFAMSRLQAWSIQAVHTNVIEPNALSAGEPFSLGLKPEWWHSQWLIMPTTTPARKSVLFRVFLKHGLLGPHVSRIEIGCQGHEPKVNPEWAAFGIEDHPGEVRVNRVPASVLLEEGPIDLKRWLPGSFQMEAAPRTPSTRALTIEP